MGLSPTKNGAKEASPGHHSDALSHVAIQSQMEKMLASESFHDAEAMRRFLRYAVEQTLRGQGGQLKEYRLGLEVFDRNSSFDPRLDPVVRMAALRLRAKLREYYEREGRHDPVCIEIPKGGYAATFSSRPAHPLRIAGKSPARRQSHFALLVGCLLVVAAIAGVYWARTIERTRAARLTEEASIAVLPFLNLTSNPDNEYLSDGLADELTGALSQMSGLRVIARTSAFKFKGKAEDVHTIGNQLNVASLLEGSLQRNGEHLRVTVQLIRTSDGSHLWAETYDSTADNTFAVEDEITQAVTGALRVRLADAESRSQRLVNPEAHDLYLRGRYWWNRRTPFAVWKSVAYFNQALEKEPLYPQAYLGLADAYTVLGFNDQEAADEVAPKARAAAEQALQIDNGLGEAHAALAATLLYHDWDFRRAEQEFRRAIQLDPNYATAHQWYGLLLMCERRFDEALPEFAKAQRLDPLSLMITLDVGQVHYYSGRQEAAIQQAQKALAQDPDFAMAHDLLGMAYEKEGRYPEALREFQTYVKLSGDDPDSLMRLALTYADTRNADAALALAKRIENVPKGTYVPSYNLAVIYATLGEKERTLEWLRRAVGEHASSCLMFAIEPAFEGLRSDPRFQSLARDVNLAPPQ